MPIGALGIAGLVIGGLMWLPDVLALFGLGLDKLRGTGLGKELLGVPDDELIEQIQTQAKRIGDQDAISVFQQDQMLQKREAGRKSFEYAEAGHQESLDISELERQIRALKAGGRTDPLNPKQSIGGPNPDVRDSAIAPTSAEALTAPQQPEISGRPETPATQAVAAGSPPLLSEDERENLRHLIIDAGLPREELA